MKRILVLFLVFSAVPAAVMATPYVSPEEAREMPAAVQDQVLWQVPPSPQFYDFDPLTRLLMCADFITTLQVSDTSQVAYGGMREGEHMTGIIQTDNTSESIWIWTRCYRRTGSDDYGDNIDAAWEYCMNFPAYDEEGGDSPTTGYYRIYNCAWALSAEMEYRDVYGDTSFSAYADSCASYLCHHPLQIKGLVGMYRRLNGMVMGWAVGNLYQYGTYVGNPIFMAKAAALSDSVKNWAEGNPNKFHWKEWAMNGGSVMWGLVNSYFEANPIGVETWVETYAPYLDTEVDSSTYQNAWRGWAALGQYTASQVLDSEVYASYFEHLADTLVANDGDNDGGIPVIDAEPDDHDQSWVTNYLGYMCMDKLIATAGLASRHEPPGEELHVTVTPMPSSDSPSLRFRLPEPSNVKVDVYDVRGRSIVSKNMGFLGPGLHTIPLPMGAADVSGAGLYFYVLDSGRKVANGKVVVLR